MSAGLTAFFVVLALLAAFYALFAPTNTKASTYHDGAANPNDEPTGLFEQLVRPAVRNFLPQTPMALTEYAKKNEGVTGLLARTGNPWKVSPEEYIAIRVLAVLAGVVLFTFLSFVGYFPDIIPLPAAFVFGGLFGYILPKALLDMRWAKRRRELTATLPEALDLLRICMNAGYSFPNALRQTVEILPPGTTKDELTRTSNELNAGRTLNEALAALAIRCPTDGIEAFARAINQATTTGSDITDTLAYQSEETRAEHERIVETRAARLQTTLFIPIILFLLPSMLIFLFGPSISALTNSI